MAEASTGATRRVEYVALDELRPAPRNPKKHSLDALGRSIERFGYVEPIVLDERTGRLVAGHGRVEHLQARRAAGEAAPDGIDATKGNWRVPVIRGWTSKDDAEAEAYLLASNRLTELGGWDSESLGEMLSQLEESTRRVTGFSEADLDLILADLAARTTGPTDASLSWMGMPPVDNQDLEAAFSVTIHFPSDEDADEFFRSVLERPKTRSMWWPQHDGYVSSDSKQGIVAE